MCDDYKIKALDIMLLKTRAYIKSYDGQTKLMYFLIKNNNLLKIFNTIWDKVSVDIKKKLITKLFIIILILEIQKIILMSLMKNKLR